MCCILTVLLLVGPRAAILVWWLLNPARWQFTFPTFIVPLLGFLLLPFTTLAYVLVAPGGVVGLDWIWLALAVMLDLGSHGGGAYSNRERIRAYR